MLAAHADLEPLFAILALAGFGVAIWLAVRRDFLAALAAALVAVLILIYAV